MAKLVMTTAELEQIRDLIRERLGLGLRVKDLDRLLRVIFFGIRVSLSFELLRSQIVLDLIRRRSPEKKITLWSAGCSTGSAYLYD